MSTIATSTRTDRPTPPRRPGLALRVRWEISPDALLRSATAAALLNGHANMLVRAWLEWCVGPGAHAALVVELSDRSVDHIPLEGSALPVTNSTGVHEGADGSGARCVDADHLKLTFVPDDNGAPMLVYAWTDLLSERLGLRGGVYDVPQVLDAGASSATLVTQP